jgi:hypothetical protein
MYFYVLLSDPVAVYANLEIGTKAREERVVRLKLTDEQAEKVKPKYCGTIRGKELFEDITPISIQEE